MYILNSKTDKHGIKGRLQQTLGQLLVTLIGISSRQIAIVAISEILGESYKPCACFDKSVGHFELLVESSLLFACFVVKNGWDFWVTTRGMNITHSVVLVLLAAIFHL